MSVHPKPQNKITIMKILLLGESNVGKTSLVTRYSEDRFDAESNLLTVGIDIRKIEKNIKGQQIRLELWDTAGQEKYKTIPSQYFKGVQGIILVYDLTDSHTFFKIEDWLDKVEENRGCEEVAMMLVGNKLDKDEQREVDLKQAETFATHHQMAFQETSAKRGQNVEQMVDKVILSILNKGIKCPVKQLKLHSSTDSTDSGCCR